MRTTNFEWRNFSKNMAKNHIIKSSLTAILVALLAFISAGCGDSDDDVFTNRNGVPVPFPTGATGTLVSPGFRPTTKRSPRFFETGTSFVHDFLSSMVEGVYRLLPDWSFEFPPKNRAMSKTMVSVAMMARM